MSGFAENCGDRIGIAPRKVWLSYEPAADTLYVNFKKPSRTTDGEMTNNHMIVRYKRGDIIGLTVLHATRRSAGETTL